MTPHALKRLDHGLTTFVDALTAGVGRRERRTAMGHYITGLLLDGERKRIEPIAARLVDDAAQIEAMRQRLQQCVVVNAWDEAPLFARLTQTLDRDCVRRRRHRVCQERSALGRRGAAVLGHPGPHR